tara:strand:- start:9343 stop:10881 length:1539 start_codon:yes stop_codon:yes gene_type:complete
VTKIIIRTIQEFKKWEQSHQKNINFIPTMGNLHKGHCRLIKEAKEFNNNINLVSIFINPLQFDNKDDLNNYPRTIERDINIAFNSGADLIFIPNKDEIFPLDNNKIQLIKASQKLSSNLCGQTRQGHFDGVCTVVNRLLEIISPEILFLGEKDWQQLLIIKEMIKNEKLKIKVNSIDTQREKDGVPLSSRNTLLSEKDRKALLFFSKELSKTKADFIVKKEINLTSIKQKLQSNKNLQVEYIQHLDAFNLQKLNQNTNISILAGAVICGKTRLIDHVFLMKRKPIIAIDGPAGSGKSTVTKLLAEKLNFLYLDTGAMYRALSWYFINQNINYENVEILRKSLKNISIIFKGDLNCGQDVFINNYCVTDFIRTQKISKIVSSISAIKEVREFLVEEQRKIGIKGGVVAEGRDIGTKVFPDAELKIFLTASIDERAKRRKLEIETKNSYKIDLIQLKEEIKQRDFDDSNRKISPLTKAKDSIEVISDGFTIKEIVDKLYKFYIEKIPKELQNYN